MNFGQAMLYGALGSLTGGMGCFGGGYGMSMYGSIFPMAGMGGYGYGYGYGCSGYGNDYYESMLTMQLGNMAAGLIVGGISHALQGKGGNESLTTADKIEAVEDKADKYLQTLGAGRTLNGFDPYKKASEYTVVSDLKGTEDKAGDKYNRDFDELGQKKNKLQNMKKEDNETAYNKLDAEIKELETKVKTEEAEYNKAKKAREEKEKAVENAIKELTDLKEEYLKLKKQKETEDRNNAINKVDGNSFTRTTKKHLDKYKGSEFDAKTAKIPSKSEVQKALYEYRKDSSADNKKVLENMASIKGAKSFMKEYGFEAIFKTLNINLNN